MNVHTHMLSTACLQAFLMAKFNLGPTTHMY